MELLKTNKQKIVRKVKWLHYQVMNTQSHQQCFWQIANKHQTSEFPEVEVIAQKHWQGFCQWEVLQKKANCLWLLLLFCNEGTISISREQELLCRRREDKKGDGVKWFVKEQQPSRLSFAHFHFQTEGSFWKKKVVIRLFGSWHTASPQPAINLS